MKRFILKSVLMIAAVVGILYLASIYYTHSNTYKNMEITDLTDRYQDMPETVSAAVFGSSHGYYGLRYGPAGTSFFNFCLPSQTPQYDWSMMRQYQDRLQPGSLVVMTVSYLSPFWTDSEETFAKKQDRYYRILSAENIVDVDYTRYYLQKFLPALTADVYDLIGAFLFDPAPLAEGEETLRPEDIAPQQENVITTHWGEYIGGVYPHTNPTMMDAYRQMLTMCREKGWIPVLVTPPYTQEYNDCFPEEFFPIFYYAVSRLCEEFDVPYLDYSHDSGYTGRLDLFFDIHHMNDAGARKLDAQFYGDLQRLGIWPADP